MSIRNRIFLSYVVLIAIIVAFVGLSGVARSLRVRIETDRAAVLELRTSWAATRMLLSDMIINWNDGTAYEEFSTQRATFDSQLQQLQERIATRHYYRDRFLPLISGLQAVWVTANAHLDRVTAVVEDPGFRLVEQQVTRQPGLQRLNHLRVELVARNTEQSRRSAHLIQRLITEVEFFPIYGDTVEQLLVTLVSEADTLQQEIARAEQSGRVVFFGTLLLAGLLLASRFSISLSRPIIEVTRRVNEFAGLTGEPVQEGATTTDEVEILSRTVERMFDHYTDLASRAEQLARGEVTGDGPQFPREGVVGRSLDEIAEYLHELASTSVWIRNGDYGSRIRERSENDVITRNFNIMSAVIYDKITTLQNMFEAVDEAVIVVDEQTVREVNSRAFRLLELDSEAPESLERISREVVPRLLAHLPAGTANEDHSSLSTTLRTTNDREIPVKFSLRVLPETQNDSRQWMFLLSDESWRAREKRERERLRAQATVAELRALRAQINPHFFFNTLNTITHLIETDTETAVETVQHLSDLFRYTLAATQRDRVPLTDEMLHVRKYLEIERLRHGETLTITCEIDRAIESTPIPPMLIQPLVENAVRYGGNTVGQVALTILGRQENDDLVIEVMDRGSSEIDLDSLFHAQGTGIRNVNQRFRTIFRRPIAYRRNEPTGLIVSLRMPLEAL